jgi:hypothetical protein
MKKKRIMKKKSPPKHKINYGQYASWDEIKAYSELSEKAFSIFNHLTRDKEKHLLNPINHLFYRMAYIGNMTSSSIRLINSWAYNLPAFALLRVRLEQTIICSYLIYEDNSIGLGKFIKYVSISRYKGMKVAMEDELLRKHLKKYKHFDKLKDDAIEAQKIFTPTFSYEHDKCERSWTKLDLRSIAKKRDSLVPKESLIKYPLETDYFSVYKLTSSVIHADSESLSHNFLDFYSYPGGPPVLMTNPLYASLIVFFNAHYDILQCHEVLNRVEISPGNQYIDLMDEWFELKEKYPKNKN